MTNECKISTLKVRYPAGYGQLGHAKLGTRLEHRYLYQKYHNVRLTSDQHVRHLCGNPACIEITHLDIGTHTDNMHDRGIYNRGEENGRAILKEEDIPKIRKLIKTKTYRDVAEMYGVSPSTINNIAQGKVWSHHKG